ncbi:MAG: hypothetical protein EXS50_02710 [Candidatus Taylorbacteria bacterium]|nr:hypothetical protein [Candidatus Taylorbacteria bacterium]
MKTFIKIIFVFSLIFSIFITEHVFAAEIRLDAHKAEINSGEQFSVDVVIHSEEPLNALQGRLIFPTDKLLVKEIHDGNSSINFWVEKPHIETPGIILFSGITPGGFNGANNSIFSVVFEAKNAGVASIVLDEAKALNNDGLGSRAVLTTHDAAIFIKSGSSDTRKEILTDIELPEDFKVTIENNTNMFDGKYFIVFATQDKISGIDVYKVREGTWGWFSAAESPYLLKHQSLDRKIFVKAVDKSGNERIVTLEAQHPSVGYQQYALVGILLIMMVFTFVIKIVWKKFTK